MAEQEGQEKSEQPTSKKLSDARDKGQVAKSTEINSLAAFGSGLILIYLTRGFIGEQFRVFSVELFGKLETFHMNPSLLQGYFINWAIFFFLVTSPVIAAVVVFAFISNLSQFSFKFASKALKPKLDKFKIFSSLKRMFFSSKSVVELAKSVVKLILVGTFSYFIIKDLVDNTTKLVELSLEEIVAFMFDSAFSLIWKIVLFFTVIAAVDYIFQRKKFNKDMMMSKQEVKEETKQQEGDPQVKGRQRSVMFKASKQRMMKEIPTADVIITNPTHFAIALKYDTIKSRAPKVVAKGVDELAQRIKAIAVEHHVPLFEDRELARALYKACDVGDEIPAKLFQAVAKILAYIFQMKRLKKKRSIV
jgi:flagellar biosynthetic protein FlhB